MKRIGKTSQGVSFRRPKKAMKQSDKYILSHGFEEGEAGEYDLAPAL
ncbi:MAG TPA: hypothetical protein VNB49_03405 [Candidatus Dormibacteraeota bacterium]|nr:hypothetical protein [Candidatus Dormibacteraeota bacterium]